MNTKICTSIKQSKKLIELEVDVNTADMTYVSMKDYGENTYYLNVGKTDVDWAKDELDNLNWNDVYEKYIPTWSFSALLELIPDKISINNESYYLSFTKKGVEFRGPITWDGQKTKSFKMDNILDSAFEMVCWLKENGKI